MKAWTLAGLLGVSWPTVSKEHVANGQSSLYVDRQLTAPCDAYTEYSGPFPQRGRPQHLIDFGTAYKITPHQQLDSHGGIGLSFAAPDYAIGFGYSIRFPIDPVEMILYRWIDAALVGRPFAESDWRIFAEHIAAFREPFERRVLFSVAIVDLYMTIDAIVSDNHANWPSQSDELPLWSARCSARCSAIAEKLWPSMDRIVFLGASLALKADDKKRASKIVPSALPIRPSEKYASAPAFSLSAMNACSSQQVCLYTQDAS